jgi:antitoxin PrlF
MSDFTKISSKGQVVIPRLIRDALSLTSGTALEVAHVGDMVVLRRARTSDLPNRLLRLAKRGEALAKRAGVRSDMELVKIVRHVRQERTRKRG